MSAGEPPRRRRLVRFARGLLVVLCGFLALWATIAMAVDGPGVIGAIVYAMLLVLLVWRAETRRRGGMVAAVVLAGTLVWWFSIPARNDREWQSETSRLAHMGVVDGILEVKDVRDFDWTAAENAVPRWVDHTYALDELQGVDLILSDWGAPSVVHTIVSFEFANGTHLAISIEARRERTEVYSAWRGFFRQFELAYVVAEERDLLGVRARFRAEKLRLYRLAMSQASARALLLTYVKRITDLADDAAWYNALTTNCTTTIRLHAIDSGLPNPWDWRMLANGRVDELLYERGRLQRELSFEELRRRSDVTQAAQDAFGNADFSTRIRSGLPERPAATDG